MEMSRSLRNLEFIVKRGSYAIVGIIVNRVLFIYTPMIALVMWIDGSLALYLIGLYLFFDMASHMVRFISISLCITNERLVYEFGILNKEIYQIEIKNIEGISVLQDLGGRFMDYGRIHIRGTGAESFTTHNIGHPDDINRSLDIARDISEEIRKLKPDDEHYLSKMRSIEQIIKSRRSAV